MGLHLHLFTSQPAARGPHILLSGQHMGELAGLSCTICSNPELGPPLSPSGSLRRGRGQEAPTSFMEYWTLG